MKKIPRLILACTLFACGGGGGSSSGVDSGLPSDKKGAELAAADETALCTAQAEHFASIYSDADAENVACVTFGAAAAALGDMSVATCQAAYDMCIDMEPEPAEDPGPNCALTFDLSTCNATVAQIEACLTAKNERTAEALKAFSCDVVDDPPPDPNAPPPAGPPACTTIESTCPGI